MKKQIKKICCSLFLAFALIVSSFFGLASGVATSIATNLALAKYESSEKNTYDFKNSGEWISLQTTEVAAGTDLDLNAKFKGSNNNLDLTTLEAGSYTPAVREGAKDNYALVIKATEAPTVVTSYKKDKDGNQVYKTDKDGKYVYEKDKDDSTKDAIFESNGGDSDLYVKVTDGYKKKIKETTTVNTYAYYRTNTSITLEENSHYVLSAWVWTKDSTASIVIEGTGFEAEYKEITTAGEWKYVELYIETATDISNDKLDAYIYFYYGTKIYDMYNKESGRLNGGIVKNPSSTISETGVVYLDELKLTKINQTDFNNQTIDGENKTTNKVSYSARYDLNGSLKESDFESFDVANDIYTTMYGQDGYNKSSAEAKDFQNFVIKYREDSTEDKYEDYELETLYELYQNSNKFSASVVEEAKEEALKITEDVLDKDGKPTYDDNNEKITEKVAYSTFNENNHALKIVNNSRYSLGLLSAPIEVDRFGYYRLSVFVRGLEEDDKATVKLLSYIKTGTNSVEGALQLKSQPVEAYTEKLENTNNWVEVVFYIRGSSLHETQSFQIALLAEKHSTIYFDNIRLENATSQAFSDSSYKLDLAPSSTLISKSVTNGYFDYIKVDNENLFESAVKTDINNPYYDSNYSSVPYKPLDWTENSGNDKDVVAGIIPTSENEYENLKHLIGNVSNPIGLDKNGIKLPKTNVLVMYAPEDADDEETTRTYSYKSGSLSLSADSSYKITFKFYAVNFTGNITAKFINSSKTVAEYKINNKDISSSEWHTVTFLFRFDSNSKSTTTLSLGIEDALGTVFFQEVSSKKLAEKTITNDEGKEEKISIDTQYNELVTEYNKYKNLTEEDLANDLTVAEKAKELEKIALAKYTSVVDYTQDSSAIHSSNKVEIVDKDDETKKTVKDYYESYGYKLKEYSKDKNVEQGELGVVDTSKDVKLSDTYTLTSSVLNNPKATSDYALIIYNGKNLQTIVNPIASITLSSSSFYELSFYVKTDAIAAGKGLTITIDKISVEFKDINTENGNYGDLTETNGYKKFTVLVRTGDSSISALNTVFTLGTENNKFSGTALLSNVSVTKLANKDAYDELVKAVDENDKTTVVKNFYVEEVDEQDQPADSLTLEIFFLVLSSLLLVVALIIAIVSVYVRRIPKTHTVVGTNNADIKNNKTKDTDTEQKDGFV